MRAKRTFERSLPVTGHVRLEICTESGDVAIEGGREGVVRVCGRIYVRGFSGLVREVLEEFERRPPIEQIGSTIRIGDVTARLEGVACWVGLDYWIETPPDTEVRVEVDSGDVRIAGLRGPVVVEADSGDVALSGIEGDVVVEVDSGDVEGKRLRGRARFNADSGDLSLRDVTGPVRASVDSGNVEVADLGPKLDLDVDSGDVSLESAVPEGARWTVRVDSGDVEVRLPRNSRCVIEAETDCGDIESDLPLKIERDDDEVSARGVLGEGTTARIEISTDSGDIALRWGER